MNQDRDAVLAAVAEFTALLHHDARCELWIRGGLNDQIILGVDGLIYCQPRDPAFEDVLRAEGLVADVRETIVDRNYVKHWFHAENDALEDSFIARFGLQRMRTR